MWTHQTIKDVSLVDVDGDEGLKHSPLDLREVASRLVNEGVE